MPDGRKKSTLPLLTILTPCYNEEGNVREVYNQVCSVMQTLPDYDYDRHVGGASYLFLRGHGAATHGAH